MRITKDSQNLDLIFKQEQIISAGCWRLGSITCVNVLLQLLGVWQDLSGFFLNTVGLLWIS